MKIKGSVKLRRCTKKQGYYSTGFARVARNKIRRLTKRLAFDPTAATAIDRRKLHLIKSPKAA